MARFVTIQTNFTAGEIDPLLRSRIDIKSYDDSGNIKIHLKLNEAYPTFLGEIGLAWNDANSIMRIPLTFTFFTWTNEKTGDLFRTLPQTVNTP